MYWAEKGSTKTRYYPWATTTSAAAAGVSARVAQGVALRRRVFDQEAVLEAAAAARLHAHAQPTDSGIDAFLGHEFLDLFARDGRDGHQDFGLVGRAHRPSSVKRKPGRPPGHPLDVSIYPATAPGSSSSRLRTRDK